MLSHGRPCIGVNHTDGAWQQLQARGQGTLVVAGPLELDEAGDNSHEAGVWGDGAFWTGLPAICSRR